MTPEETKKQLEQLSGDLNTKMNAYEAKMAALEIQIKEAGTKPNTEVKKELTDLATKHDTATQELRETLKKLNEQTDAIEIKMKKGGFNLERMSLKQHIAEQIETNKAGMLEVAEGKRSSVILKLKADMTIANNFSGEVIPAQYLPGIFYDPTRRIHIRDVINTTAISSDTVRYPKETAYTDNAATRGEGSAAGQTDATLTATDEPVRKINTHMTLSKEMLADAGFMENFIRTRALGKLLSKEDTEILYGTGVAPNLNGLSKNSKAYSDLLNMASTQRYDVLANAATNARTGEYEPTLAIVHPQDYLKIITTKDGNNLYVNGNIFTGQPITVNGAKIFQTTAMTADDFFVGDMQQGVLFGIRSDVEVTMTNSHDANFIKGLVTILLEERVVLIVYRPNAIIFGTFTNAINAGTA